jgi:tripartite-type tricarboxylate transporter receptor subunit TctC
MGRMQGVASNRSGPSLSLALVQSPSVPTFCPSSAPPSINTGNRCSFIRELPPGRAEGPSGELAALVPTAGEHSENQFVIGWRARSLRGAVPCHQGGHIVKLLRRQFLHFAAGAVALPAISRIARAQTYPARPVRCIVGYPAGGGTDIFVRLVGQPLSDRLGQSLVIENRPGATSNIATDAVVRAAADGYTLIATDAAAAINATLFDNLSFNFVRDIAVVGMAGGPNVLLVHPSVPAKTVPEFIAYAKANPGKISMGSPGTGNSGHLAGELFKAMTNIDMTHVPYRGAAPAITDLLGGQVQVLFNGVAAVIEHIRSGRLRALAVTSKVRVEVLSDIPTVNDFVPGYEAVQWYAVGLRKSTPAEIIERLNQEINAILGGPNMQMRLADMGVAAFLMSSVELGTFVANETVKWAKVIRAANIKAE